MTILLSLVSFAEYPFLWSRTGDLDPPGVMGGRVMDALDNDCYHANRAISWHSNNLLSEVTSRTHP